MRKTILSLLLLLLALTSGAVEVANIVSPNQQVSARVVTLSGKTYLDVYNAEGKRMTRITLGLKTSGEQFTSLSVDSVFAPEVITESYDMLHGKRSHVKNEATAVKVRFLNAKQSELGVEVRAWNDGVTFRYSLPDNGKTRTFTGEATNYLIEQADHRWLMEYNTSYEGDFPYQASASRQGDWAFPCLFEHKGYFMLITEANASRQYCSTHLNNSSSINNYVVSYPYSWEGNSTGEANPSWEGEWTSPWRVVIVGDLNTIATSTLVEDCSDPTQMTDLSWIKPGSAAWVYWAYNHGTRDFQICKAYVDLAYKMGWEYVLFDWEWDSMYNGGNIQDACKYALSKGIKPMMWYNSGGPHNSVGATPRDRMLTHENRVAEFKWLKNMGVVGVKIDFFESDKQHMMNYYLDILEDARDAQMLVNFHGATIPRGWTRTYPHLMSTEGVFGAEQYNNGSHMTDNAPRINCTFPFTRNVVGPMDYTPVAFTNSQHPHTTTYAHELALAVVFESGIQHWADRPEGFYALPGEPMQFMKEIPTAWDETRLLDGYPGQYVVMARRKGDVWYVGGLEGTSKETQMSVKLDFLEEGVKYMAVVNYDGATMSEIKTSYYKVTNTDCIDILCLSRGGFTISLKPESYFGYQNLVNLRKDVQDAVSKAKTTKATTQAYYDKAEITLLQEALTLSKAVTEEQTVDEILSAYIALQEAFSRFQKDGYITGGAIHHPELTQNVTAKYLVEARMFTRAEDDDVSKRYGAPKYWTVENYNIDKGSEGAKQGIDTYTGWNSLSLGVWDDSQNAKGNLALTRLYRYVELPAGKYFLGGNYNSTLGIEKGYLFAGKSLPTASTVTSKSLFCSPISNLGTGSGLNGITFTLSIDSKVYLGWVADLTTSGNCEFRANEIQLLRYLDAEEEWIASEAACVTPDTPLYVAAPVFANMGTSSYAWGPKKEGILNSPDGTILTVGQIDLTGIDAVTIHGNLPGSTKAGSKFEILLDNANTEWTTVPALKKTSTVTTSANAEVPPISGIHTVKIRIKGATTNVWGITFENRNGETGIYTVCPDRTEQSSVGSFTLTGTKASKTTTGVVVRKGSKMIR